MQIVYKGLRSSPAEPRIFPKLHGPWNLAHGNAHSPASGGVEGLWSLFLAPVGTDLLLPLLLLVLDALDLIMALPLFSFVTLGKSCHFLRPQFLHLYSESS